MGGERSLQFYDLSPRWGHGMPEWPSIAGISTLPLRQHAKDGEQVLVVDAVMHRGSHVDTPIHVMEGAPYLDGFALWRFFGTGVAVSVPKGKWECITAEDLEAATPRIEPGDIVMINTGSHHNWGDGDDYFAYSPGLVPSGARWLVERRVKLVGLDVQALDHPLATKLLDHGPGPSHPHLEAEYEAFSGRSARADFPDWEPCHRILLGNGIPGIENVGGDLDRVTGQRCTFMAFPWRWHLGDGSGLRVVAVVDPTGQYRIEPGV